MLIRMGKWGYMRGVERGNVWEMSGEMKLGVEMHESRTENKREIYIK